MTQTREGLIQAMADAILACPVIGPDMAHAALAALEAHAAVVPREPTQEMRHAGGSARVYPSCYMGGPPPAAQRDAQRIYEAMCAVSPFAPEKEARDD